MTQRNLLGILFAGWLGVTACVDNGNDVGYERSETGGEGGDAIGGGPSTGGRTGGASTGGVGVGATGGLDEAGGSSAGANTGGARGGSGGTGGGPDGTGGVLAGGTGGGGPDGSGGVVGGMGGTHTGGTGGPGGTGGVGNGGAGGADLGGAGAAAGGTGGVDTGGAGGEGGDTGGCAPLPSCNWCGGDPYYDSRGCTTGWICANGDDPCSILECSSPADCEADEICGEDTLCWPAEPTELNRSEFDYVDNPCTTDPCLPGVVAAIVEDGHAYVIVVDGHWVDTTYDWEAEWNFNGLPGQTTMAAGVVSYHTDIDGTFYYEIELTSLTYRVF